MGNSVILTAGRGRGKGVRVCRGNWVDDVRTEMRRSYLMGEVRLLRGGQVSSRVRNERAVSNLILSVICGRRWQVEKARSICLKKREVIAAQRLS